MKLSDSTIVHGLSQAYALAANSKDPSTQNGAIVLSQEGEVIGRGWNAFPSGVESRPERWARPLKYSIIEHAERNAIFYAARMGQSTYKGFMMCPWAACADCARAIIQSGIKTLVRHQEATDRSPDSWKESIAIADEMLDEAGVTVIDYSGQLDVGGEHFQVLHTGELWRP